MSRLDLAFLDAVDELLVIFGLSRLGIFGFVFSEGLEVLSLKFVPVKDGFPVGPVLLTLFPLREKVVVDGETGLPGIVFSVGEDFVEVKQHVCSGRLGEVRRHAGQDTGDGTGGKLGGRQLVELRPLSRREPVRVQGFVRPESLLLDVTVIICVLAGNKLFLITPDISF